MTSKRGYEELFRRHPGNPILSASDWPYPVHTAFNPGAIRLKNGSTLLLCRVEDRRGHSHLSVAHSRNGIDGWVIDESPTLMPAPHPEEMWGIEDPRITFVEELDKYLITYTAYGEGGPGVAMALTEDFKTFERGGLILPPHNKDAALLPHRIDGNFILYHRPMTDTGAHVWLSRSPDLRHWGDHTMVLQARRGGWWDANKVGISTPPIETSQGWLMIYHGVRMTAAGCLYRLGLALFSLEKPECCLLRGNEWIFEPEAEYERTGDVGYVTFPCGLTVGEDGDRINLYYGAADTSIALATGSIRECLHWLEENGAGPADPKESSW